MKRSEMVRKLAEFIALFEDQSPDACLNLADQYLRAVEDEGMVPPTTDVLIMEKSFKYNCWDEEDEE